MLWVPRVLNMLHCSLSFLKSFRGQLRFAHMPTTVAIEPADFCQLHCPECPVGINKKRHGKVLSVEAFQKILNAIPIQVHTLIFYFQGEPTLNPNLPQMIQMAHERHFFTLLSTNAQHIDNDMAIHLAESGLNRIILSIDGLSQEAYSTYRKGGSVGKALNAMQMLVKAKRAAHSSMVIEWQCLALRSNQQEWHTMRKFSRELGANRFVLKTAQFYNFENGNSLMPHSKRYSRYKQLPDGTFIRKKPFYHHCWKLWSSCVIDIEGNMLPCCFDKNREHRFGNIFSHTFREIWLSNDAMLFRQKVLTDRQHISICQNCSE